MIEQSYFIKERICPVNLPCCELDRDAWQREENCKELGLLDHFLTEYTEDYYRQDYLGIDPASWKVKLYHTTRANVVYVSVLMGCHSPLCHSHPVGKSVLTSQETFWMCHGILSGHLRETNFP